MNDWVVWSGGDRPRSLPTDTQIEVRLRDGTVLSAARPAWQWRWRHVGNETDIIAYRAVSA